MSSFTGWTELKNAIAPSLIELVNAMRESARNSRLAMQIDAGTAQEDVPQDTSRSYLHVPSSAPESEIRGILYALTIFEIWEGPSREGVVINCTARGLCKILTKEGPPPLMYINADGPCRMLSAEEEKRALEKLPADTIQEFWQAFRSTVAGSSPPTLIGHDVYDPPAGPVRSMKGSAYYLPRGRWWSAEEVISSHFFLTPIVAELRSNVLLQRFPAFVVQTSMGYRMFPT